MVDKITSLKNLIGNTPIKKLEGFGKNLYVKLEYHNFSGSIKDRAAYNILLEAIREGRINRSTKIIESSSGNFAVALGYICNYLQLCFIPVIDPNINPAYEKLLNLLVPNVVKVNTRDETGGFLLTRIQTVKDIRDTYDNIFWTNQYENPNNYKGYYDMAYEIHERLGCLDYIFVGVSSGGTITGLSQKLKEYYPNVKVIGVDVEGSVIFSQTPKRRHISGIGSSRRPPILDHAIIDDVIHLSEAEIIYGCRELLKEQTLFAGASTGASYAAVKKYFQHRPGSRDQRILFLSPDKGSAYIDTVYNEAWTANICLQNVKIS